MERELLIALFAGIGGMLGWGLADFFAKKTINEIGDVATLAWAHIFGTLVLLIIVIFRQVADRHFIQMSFDAQTWALFLFFGTLQAAVYLLVYKGFSKGHVSILSPIFASFSGFTAAISILIFGEIVNNYVFLGLAILFIGILLMNFDLTSIKINRIRLKYVSGLSEIISATVLAVLWTLLWDKFIDGKDWLAYAFFMYAFMTFAILVFAIVVGINLRIIHSHLWKFLLIIGLCENLAYGAISWGYSMTSMTSIIALLSGAFSLPTIFLARIFLKEKITLLQIISGLIIITGVMILSIL
jgi:drug/metabolite transporter (DMT)-like permease